MKKSELKTFFKWLEGEDLMTDSTTDLPPVERETNKHIYEEEAHRLRRVEAAEKRSFNKLYVVLCILLVTVLSAVLIFTVSNLPEAGSFDTPVNNEVSERYIESGLKETGATNIVAGMILDYRAFDTLGESHVLFTAMCAVVILLLPGRKQNDLRKVDTDDGLYDITADPILSTIALILVPCLLVFGVYILLNGHLSPGGGFSGGAVLGAALIFHSMAFGFKKTERFLSRRNITIITCLSLGFYVVAKAYSFITGANHLPSIISTGTPGAIFSAGLILPLNVAVGFVVACTMYSFFSLFKRGRI